MIKEVYMYNIAVVNSRIYNSCNAEYIELKGSTIKIRLLRISFLVILGNLPIIR